MRSFLLSAGGVNLATWASISAWWKPRRSGPSRLRILKPVIAPPELSTMRSAKALARSASALRPFARESVTLSWSVLRSVVCPLTMRSAMRVASDTASAALPPVPLAVTFVGFAAGYFGYITIHWLIHHSSRQFIAPLKAHHDMHHRRARVNFGVSTRLWDVVFRTRA